MKYASSEQIFSNLATMQDYNFLAGVAVFSSNGKTHVTKYVQTNYIFCIKINQSYWN